MYRRLRVCCPLCKSMGGIGLLCHKMRSYGPTVQVREELRLDSLCTVDVEDGAHCVSKWGVYAHCVIKVGSMGPQYK